jgi:hypothetical protein
MKYRGFTITSAQQERGWVARISHMDGTPVLCQRYQHEFFETMLCQTKDLAEAHARGAVDHGIVT